MKPILERLPDSVPAPGEDDALLKAFKIHTGLPSDSTYTEADRLLKMYLAAAEKTIDTLTGNPLRARLYTYTLSCIPRCGRYYGFKLPIYPIAPDTVIAWTDNDGETGTFEEDTDFKVFGKQTLTPEIIFTDTSLVLPKTSNVLYPYIANFTSGVNQNAEVFKVAMFELAAFYYRFPEAMTDSNPNVGAIYQANIDLIANNFL